MGRYASLNAEAEPWEIGDIAGHLTRGDLGADGLVLREIARHMAVALAAAHGPHPWHPANDIHPACAAIKEKN